MIEDFVDSVGFDNDLVNERFHQATGTKENNVLVRIVFNKINTEINLIKTQNLNKRQLTKLPYTLLILFIVNITINPYKHELLMNFQTTSMSAVLL